MKELAKKRWVVFLLGILIAVVVLFGIGFVLYCNGYRITYPQQFETSWDAVSGFAAWFGVVVSVVSAAASFFAIWFAVRVADKQNKIALFEKRYELFVFVDRCKLFDSALKRNKDYKNIRHLFLLDFFDVLQRSKAEDNDFFTEKIGSCFNRTRQTDFLFKDSDIHVLMGTLSTIVYEIIYASLSIEEGSEKTNELDSAIKEFTEFVNSTNYQKLVAAMQKELMLK